MTRMFGLISNRSDLTGHVLALSAPFLKARNPGRKSVGWGVGFYQSGEILLHLRPTDNAGEVDLGGAVSDLRTDLAIAHLRRPQVGSLAAKNTQPFRYGLWLFAQTGTIQAFDRLAARLITSQPEFLRRNIRGETDGELLFHLFLSFLHDSGHLLDEQVSASPVRDALRAAVSLVDRLSAEEGCGPNTGDILVSNGELLVGVHRDGLMAIRVFEGERDLDELFSSDDRRRIPNIGRMRLGLIASELDSVPSGWTAVADRTMVTMTRDDVPSLELL